MQSISQSEKLTRFIFHSNEFSLTNNRVKYNVFLPNPNNGETSVFRISETSDNELCKIDNYVSKERKKPTKGRADIYASNVFSKELYVIPSEPPARHANITNWSSEKSAKKLIAIELASEAELKLKKA